MPSPHSRLRFRLLVAALSCAALAGCSAAPSGATVPPGGAGATDTTAVSVPDGNRLSGAKVRVANLFNPISGDPGPIDIYAAPWVLAGAKPLLSVPYGQLSPAFDPTVSDDAGDMFLSFYASGVTGNGAELMSQTETLKGTESIVFYLATGSLQDNGTYGGALGTAFATSSVDFGGPTLPPGKVQLTVSAVGLDKILKDADKLSWVVGIGGGCAPGTDGDPANISVISPGTTGGDYALDPGQTTLSFHPFDESAGTAPVCTNSSALDVQLETTAGQKVVVVLYAPKDGQLKALVIPVTN